MCSSDLYALDAVVAAVPKPKLVLAELALAKSDRLLALRDADANVLAALDALVAALVALVAADVAELLALVAEVAALVSLVAAFVAEVAATVAEPKIPST